MSLKELKAKKKINKTNLTKLKDKLSISELEQSELILIKEKHGKLEQAFSELFESIYKICKDDETEDFIKENEEINEILENMEFELSKRLSKMKLQNVNLENASRAENNIKLPKLTLPVFTGNLHEWLSFKDIFKATVHENSNLSGAMKLQYLKSSLRGDAFRIIQSISIVDSNYEVAWSLLEERYSNSREQVYAHLKRFLNIPVIQNESPTALLNLIDITNECIRSLEILEQKVEGFSTTMFAYILAQKLDANTKMWWERHLKRDNLPSLTQLLEFLRDHARTLSASKQVNAKRNFQNESYTRHSLSKVTSMVTSLNEKNHRKCVVCNQENHSVFKCPKFQNLNVQERVDFVKKHNLCFNCLSESHCVKKCNSTFSCIKCHKRHNILLCFNRRERNSTAMGNTKNSNDKEAQNALAANESRQSLNVDAIPFEINNQIQSFSGTTNVRSSNVKKVLLSTAVVYMRDKFGNKIPVRTLLDSGSMSNFLTLRLVERLGIRKEKSNVLVSCLSGSSVAVKNKTTALISNNSGDYSRELDFLIIQKISQIMPSRYIDISELEIPESIILADPEFNRPGQIDLLLGAEIFLELLKVGRMNVPNSKLILQNTVFGCIVSGSVYDCSGQEQVHCGLVTEADLNFELKKFWEIERVEETTPLRNTEELACDTHFINTHHRDLTGKFIVQMPLKKDASSLGESKQFAENRLNSLWRRLDRNPNLLELYCAFMSEYRELGHMEEVKETDESIHANYLPHHAVYRPDKSSTKLRVVFNGSHVTSSGESLNSIQLNGGVIQDELFTIILRFRTHCYAFTADVKMMYRMILIDESQRDLQRIVWKDSANGEVKSYKLCTVTYGTTSAPYLAMRCLKQLGIDGESQFPYASGVVQSDFYMDDVLTGAADLNLAKKLQAELIQLLSTCGMKLHKWFSNHPELMESVSKPENYTFDKMSETKALGLCWKAHDDTFTFSVSFSEQTKVTKRNVLSDIARIFDPLGILCPVVTKAKIFLQRLWRLEIGWDEILPTAELDDWLQFRESLKAINNVSAVRYIFTNNPLQLKICGFSDASEKAYGVALYVVSSNSSGEQTSQLLCSKSRVSPLKTITIPKLELCAAVLLAKLVNKVFKILKMPKETMYYYSDSTIVLCWIRKQPCDLKTFVASRVSTIQNLSDINHWGHVASADNPADLVSRGVDPDKLLQNSLWWNGPQFIRQQTDHSSNTFELEQNDKALYLSEFKKTVSKTSSETCLLISDCPSFIDNFLQLSNDYAKLIRILSYVFRFIQNLKEPKARCSGRLTSAELKRAEQYLIKSVQEKEFRSEFTLLSKGKEIPKNSRLLSLNPFLDKNNLIRVGGRLQNSMLSYVQKHPIVLPSKHKLTELIIEFYHKKYLHLGPQNLLYCVRREFWPLNGRAICRKIVHKCVVCFRAKPKISEQIMGELPKERINVDFVFNCTGADFCGPFLIKYKGQRKGIFHKIYVCIFICMVTKAVHLEIVSDLTSEAFIATLKRFFARRGKPRKIFSDNAGNFVKTNLELKKLQALVNKPDNNLTNYLLSECIQWEFIPPRAPNFGGLWESGVKSFKYHLKRVVGNSKLTYEEMLTIIIQIEGILNSRPLTPLSANIDDLEVLTPGHFLIGRPLNAIAESDLSNVSDNRLNLWQKTTKMVQTIWKRWKNSYLSTLQQRNKWVIAKNNLKIGDMVVIKEDDLPTCKWLLGRIEEVFFGNDNRVRVVKVKTQNGVFKRAVSKIAVLPLEN